MESPEQRMVRIARLEEQRAMRRSLPAPETVSGEVVEARSLTSGLANPAGWLTEAMGTYTAPSGQRVTVEKALGLSPVWSAVSIIAEQVGQLPLKVYRRFEDPEGESERVEARQHRSWRLLHDKPNASTPADRFWSAVTAQLLLYGNAFIEKVRSDPFGDVDELWLFEPEAMTIAWNPVRRAKQFVYQPKDLRPKRKLDESEVLHVFGLSLDGIAGLSVIQFCKASLGAALARDEFEGGFYNRGATLSGVIKHPNKLTTEAAQHLGASFRALYAGSGNSHGTPVLEEGSEFVKIGSPLGDLQFVESQNLSRTDIAVMFKLPPNYLGGSSGDSLTYATVESNGTHFAMHAIAPVTNTIAKALSNDPELLPQQVFEAEFELKALMRGTTTDRVAYYKAMKDMSAMTVDEIRREENMPALSVAQKNDLAPAAPSPQLPPPQDQQGQGAQVMPMRVVNG
jgi:HK97 family phage portal protein